MKNTFTLCQISVPVFLMYSDTESSHGYSCSSKRQYVSSFTHSTVVNYEILYSVILQCEHNQTAHYLYLVQPTLTLRLMYLYDL